jgi:glycerol-3-phosphate dehydrogenase
VSARYDVCIIGGGVTGCAIAWRLAREDVRVALVERAGDVAEGASKGNSGITASGYDTVPGTLESRLVCASSPRWERICADLDVPFRRIGALALAFTDEEVERGLPEHLEQARANGIPAEIVGREEIARLAPAASREARAALHVPDEGIIDPIRLTIGYAEAAARNGCDVVLGAPVVGFERDGDRLRAARTPRGRIEARWFVNAAGLGSDEVSAAAGAERFRMWPRKGQFLLVDRDVGRRLGKVLTPIPNEHTRGILAIPTTNRTVLLGPTADDLDAKDDKATDAATLDRVFAAAQRLWPEVERRHVIKTFAGLRPASERTYRVERSEAVPNLVHAAAIRSTGVSGSPAVADEVRRLLGEAGLEARPRPHLARIPRPPRLAELSAEAFRARAGGDDRGKVVICACEHVTALEVAAARDAAVPARSVEGVRKRTRATAGRCQGAYCSAGVRFVLGEAP